MKGFYNSIDANAKKIAEIYHQNKPITGEIVNVINELYKSIETEKNYNDEHFESAYQMSITPLFEFFIARLLYHLSSIRGLGWKIFLRRQKEKCAPDIRIEQNGKQLAVIEIKIKGGWIQPFFSDERFQIDKKRLENGESDFDPQDLVDKHKEQLDKYRMAFGKDILLFMLLPTFNLVHRKKYKADYNTYKQVFVKNTGLSEDRLVVLSSDLSLNLAKLSTNTQPELTGEFERMIKSIECSTLPST